MRARRFDPLIRHAEQRESAVARDFADKNAALSTQEQRLADLTRYAEEYAAPRAGQAVTPAMLANRNAFRERIDDALAQQRRAVETSRSHCELERARLLLASRETKVMEKLAASHRAAEGRTQARRSQNELDDLAARAFTTRVRIGEEG